MATSCKWEELTAVDFPAKVRAVGGVCVVPIGVMEKHGEHLPVGTDQIAVEAVAARAVAIEPAIIFPRYYWGQAHECKHGPGAVAVRHHLLFGLLENVCEEIARNGLGKIVLLNGHGGNRDVLPTFVKSMVLERPRPYTVYLVDLGAYMGPVLAGEKWQAMKESDFEEHAGEAETSAVMAIRPELVKMDDLPPAEAGRPQGRLGELQGAANSMFWYGDFPGHYAGNAAASSPAKGEFLLAEYAERVARALRAIKDDSATRPLEQEYFSRTQY